MEDTKNLGKPIPILTNGCKPVFVVGMNGSGTTMLLDSLGQHPELYGFPWETKLIPHWIASVGKFGDLEIDENFLSLWNSVCMLPDFRRVNDGVDGVPPSLPENWRQFPRNLASILDAVFRFFALKEGKTRWCEKTPQHVQHMPKLKKLFPNAKFIHIIRDCRASVASNYRRFGSTPEYTAWRWRNVVQEGRQQGVKLGNSYMEINYEEVTTNPQHWMREICSFLELPFDEVVLLSARRQDLDTKSHGSNVGKIEANTAKWKQHLSSRTVLQIEKISGALLQELGYSIKHTPGAEDPSRMMRSYWKWRDWSRQFLPMVIKKLRGKSGLSWSYIFGRLVSALKQAQSKL